MKIYLECRYCGHIWHVWYYNEKAKHIECEICKDKNIKVNKYKTLDFYSDKIQIKDDIDDET